jgi:hypothetical protein
MLVVGALCWDILFKYLRFAYYAMGRLIGEQIFVGSFYSSSILLIYMLLIQAIVGTLVSEESIFEEDISSVSNGSGQGAEVVGMESNSRYIKILPIISV